MTRGGGFSFEAVQFINSKLHPWSFSSGVMVHSWERKAPGMPRFGFTRRFHPKRPPIINQ